MAGGSANTSSEGSSPDADGARSMGVAGRPRKHPVPHEPQARHATHERQTGEQGDPEHQECEPCTHDDDAREQTEPAVPSGERVHWHAESYSPVLAVRRLTRCGAYRHGRRCLLQRQRQRRVNAHRHAIVRTNGRGKTHRRSLEDPGIHYQGGEIRASHGCVQAVRVELNARILFPCGKPRAGDGKEHASDVFGRKAVGLDGSDEVTASIRRWPRRDIAPFAPIFLISVAKFRAASRSVSR